jgi:phosphoribosylaminoimidazolecarboxamide formyltransferase/IMP cyclohydrolase
MTGFALLSVSDKRGIVDLGRGLVGLGFQLLSTGGTAAVLRDAGLFVSDIAQHTATPEMLEGRVKTLHPRVHGGILARRDLPEHMATLAELGIPPIDIVAVNLYPFAQTVAKAGCSMHEAIENIDIGGPAMVRAAAKNHGGEVGGVGIVTDPDDYASVLGELREEGALSAVTRYRLAVKAFTHTARYDGMVANWLSSRMPGGVAEAASQVDAFPERLQLGFDRLQTLRYGENPHQAAAFYRDPLAGAAGGIAGALQLQGKALSYNNIADADAAWECVKAFAAGACVIVKHANPCGVALSETPLRAYQRAFATDPTSAFGGIIAFNREVDAAAAEGVSQQFIEVLIAPSYTPDALALFAARANVRVLQCAHGDAGRHQADADIVWDLKRVGGGLLVQTRDLRTAADDALRVVTDRQPTAAEMADLRFAWTVARFVKSNAIVYCKDGQTVGVGAGQMSRIDSTRIARIKAEHAGLQIAGSVVASDAFFPFRDGLDVLAEAGATAVIQPGGSQRDAEVIAAADQHGIAMVFTGFRHFRH